MIKSNGGIIGPDNVTTGGPFGSASGVFKLGEVTDLVKESKWPTPGPQGYQSANSCRFNGSSSKLVKSQSAGNRDLWTYSVWIKWSAITTTTTTFFASSDGSNLYAYIGIQSYKIRFLDYNSGNQTNLITNRLFRDPSAWYHVVLAYDSAQGTASNRVKLYINGVQETSFSTETYPSQGLDSAVNVNSSNFIISSNQDQSSGSMWNGYMAESCFIDGQALAPTSFGEFDEDSGIWKPIDVSGLTFGTNGFYLDFKDSANLGNDANGGTDFTESGLAAIDQSTDTCTNNFATWNPLVHYSTSAVFSEGNLKVVPQDNTSVNYTTSTIAMPQSGKWYAEFKKLQNDNRLAVGIIDTDLQTGIFQANNYLKDVVAGGIMYDSINGKISGNNGDIQTGLTAAGNNAIIGLAVDMDNKLFYVYVNGSLINSGGSGASFSYLTGTYAAFWVGDVATSGYDNCEANFGNPPFTISSGNTDGNGYGNFEYAVPSGYYALNTKNLAEYG